MSNNPLVTVICLCYNHEAYVTESLDSVINQSYLPIQLIIVDDFSTDNSKVVIENWIQNHPKIKFITNETNLGNTKSFNKALQEAKGEYIIDLATDDILLPNCVMTQINAFKNSTFKNLGVVYGNAELISEKGLFNSFYFPVNAQKKVIEKRITGDIYQNVLSDFYSICSVSAMIKKSVIDHLEGYDESLAYEDLDFWMRASRIYDFDFIDEVIMQKRIVSNSLATNFYKKNDPQTKKIDYSTYLILKKGIQLNQSIQEDLAIQKRVHNSIINCLENKNYWLVLKNFKLRIILAWRKKFKKYIV
ncbi:glycosyltransferase [Flavobacterium sp. LM4]|uniref:glycosyltransferase family 2 protein n=1 Tax=Flavobacterium sp. LM4 TaxID=1938609 RepID=UPI000991AE37|nr:glycosyltransferase [Flavobacterium sp. LM4]OOV13055.1 glycosyltransferase [Flavobacterium sp. LM4]